MREHAESLGEAIARVLADAVTADKTALESGHTWSPSLALAYVTGEVPLPAEAPPMERCQGCGTPQLPVLIPGNRWVVPNPCSKCVGVAKYVNSGREKRTDPGERMSVLERKAGLLDERLKRARHTIERHGMPTYERIERADSFTYIESASPTRYLVAAAQASIREGLEGEGKRSVMALRTDWWLADLQASWSDERIKVARASQLYTHDHVLLELRDPMGGWKPWAEEEVLGLIVARYNAMKMTTLISPDSLEEWLKSGSKLGAALRQVVPNEGGF